MGIELIKGGSEKTGIYAAWENLWIAIRFAPKAIVVEKEKPNDKELLKKLQGLYLQHFAIPKYEKTFSQDLAILASRNLNNVQRGIINDIFKIQERIDEIAQSGTPIQQPFNPYYTGDFSGIQAAVQQNINQEERQQANYERMGLSELKQNILRLWDQLINPVLHGDYIDVSSSDGDSGSSNLAARR